MILYNNTIESRGMPGMTPNPNLNLCILGGGGGGTRDKI